LPRNPLMVSAITPVLLYLQTLAGANDFPNGTAFDAFPRQPQSTILNLGMNLFAPRRG
jgi:hypothetical protein